MSVIANRQTVVDANNLKKYYGKVKAFDGISFQVIKNKIFGFLGPNGTGKTTTIKFLTGSGLAEPGQCHVLWHSLFNRP